MALGSIGHFNNINSSNPCTWDVFPLVCAFFTFFHQSLVALYRSFMSLVKFTPEYFIVFDAVVNGIVLKFLFQMFCC